MSGPLSSVPVFEVSQIITGSVCGVSRLAEPLEDLLEIGGVGAQGADGEGGDHLGDRGVRWGWGFLRPGRAR